MDLAQCNAQAVGELLVHVQLIRQVTPRVETVGSGTVSKFHGPCPYNSSSTFYEYLTLIHVRRQLKGGKITQVNFVHVIYYSTQNFWNVFVQVRSVT